MKYIRLQPAATLIFLYCATVAYAQQAPTTATIPRLVRFSGSLRPANGTPPQTTESLTLSVYKDQTSGDALWQEIQNVAIDSDGRYSVLMGATKNEGMPVDLFTSGEPRWLGVQFNRAGEAEQPRILLVSVPYALKAADAETLGGKPASAYMLAAPAVRLNPTSAPSGREASPTVTDGPIIGGMGTKNFIPIWATPNFLLSSVIYQATGGNVGIGTQTPGSALDVAGDVNLSGKVLYQGSPLLQVPGGSGNANVAVGIGALASNTSGTANTATGNGALGSNTIGNNNTAIGEFALYVNTGGYGNTAIGVEALRNTNNVGNNTAIGYQALASNTIGHENTAIGNGALGSNMDASYNTAIGSGALSTNTGAFNTATGEAAMASNTTGYDNTASGVGALQSNTTGVENTVIGSHALTRNTTGGGNIAIGFGAGFNVRAGSNNIYIANGGVDGDAGTIRIGTPTFQTSFFAAGIRGVTTTNNDAIPVMIDSAGQLGTVSSSRRFKEDIADMGGASGDLMRLRPVTFRYQKPFADGSKPIQYGLIAEEVAEVYPDLVAHSADGQIETVKYQVLDSMLLNEVQRQQAEIGAQKDQIRQLQERFAKMEAALAASPSVGSVPNK